MIIVMHAEDSQGNRLSADNYATVQDGARNIVESSNVRFALAEIENEVYDK